MKSLFFFVLFFFCRRKFAEKKNMMASNDVKTNVSITLTGKEAENQIEVLKKKAEELRKKLKEAKQALYSISQRYNIQTLYHNFF